MCGIPIIPNAANTCATCLASSADITKGISTQATLHQCRGCQRWHKEEGKWIACELESRELMSLCLSHISGLRSAKKNVQNTFRLVDASWIWTEPHSMRLKVRLTVQREIQAGTILQQSFLVVFIVRNQQCVECQAEFRQGTWKSLVQVRQRVSHKRTFLYLEQLILKHGAHRGCLSIETFRDGMDFYFPEKSKAARFISFLESVCPIKIKTSKKLISTDDRSNIANFKYTNYVEICPLCKDDLLFLPAPLARNLGNISRLVLVKNVSNVIHVVDPLTGQQASMNPEAFWRDPFRPLITAARSRMTRFMVLGKEPFFLRQNISKRASSRKMKSRLALVTIAREDDLGVNDTQVEMQSHVGYLMKSGDICVGYDLKDTQFVDDEAESLRAAGKLPDAILVRKLYGSAIATTTSGGNAAKRAWRLQRLDVDYAEVNPKARGAKNSTQADEMDEEEFLQEVEADKEMRQNMNLYKSSRIARPKTIVDEDGDAIVDDADDEDEDDDQKINLDELLDGLDLESGPDPIPVAEEEEIQLHEEGAKATKDGIKYVSREEARHVRDKETAIVVSGGLGKDFEDL